jgi:hypothetical protein
LPARWLAAGFDLLDLPAHFAVDGFLDEAERVDVLDLAAGAEFGFWPTGPHRDTLQSQRIEPSFMLPSEMPR